jgi:hypothetical protein
MLPAMLDPTPRPADELVTTDSLRGDIARLGVEPGMVVIAHVSLSALGWVVGGEAAVVAALRAALGKEGTLVMPAQSWQLCDPAYLADPADPAVPERWWPAIRESLPAYDARTTPTRTMGLVAEHFRTLPGTVRSAHPHRSFAAAGPHAATSRGGGWCRTARRCSSMGSGAGSRSTSLPCSTRTSRPWPRRSPPTPAACGRAGSDARRPLCCRSARSSTTPPTGSAAIAAERDDARGAGGASQ